MINVNQFDITIVITKKGLIGMVHDTKGEKLAEINTEDREELINWAKEQINHYLDERKDDVEIPR